MWRVISKRKDGSEVRVSCQYLTNMLDAVKDAGTKEDIVSINVEREED
jgi:hypothetical protein|tara:strand:+ start:280 stop:423 length:144 start_codon:yes stop_codon:yes gene_type:complete